MKIYHLFYCNILNLRLKNNSVTKRIFTATILLATFFSCNDAEKKSDDNNAEAVKNTTEKGHSDRLVYLDTARNLYNLLCQDWVSEDDADALEGMTEDSKFEIPYRSIFFAPNGTFVKNPRNAMDYGNWVYDDAAKTITLNYTSINGKDIYKIAELGPDNLKLKNTLINTTTILPFVGSGKRFKDINEDPFYIENNRWRIKPSKKETDAEIHQRLKDNIHFFVLYYKAVLVKEEKNVSFWGLPSCIKFFSKAIFIKKPEELKENWIRCFYNKEQAMQAYALADKLLEQKYTWPKGDKNWIEQNLAVLEQMYKKVDELR